MARAPIHDGDTVDAPASGGCAQLVERLLTVLRDYAGFRSTPALRRRLERIFAAGTAVELAAWLSRLQAGPAVDELAALVEDLTNHETYFFRDRPQLAAFEDHIVPALLHDAAASGRRSLRIWSAACATGEEVFTLALIAVQVMLSARLAVEIAPGEIRLADGWNVQVIGTDISRQALRVAREAAYPRGGLGAFRHFPPQYERFFERLETPQRRIGDAPVWLRVRNCIRRLVHFEPFNLIQPLAPLRQCDAVFCRNVLIYIEQDRQTDVQRMLAGALRRGGVLVMSPVDTLYHKTQFVSRQLEECLVHERI